MDPWHDYLAFPGRAADARRAGRAFAAAPLASVGSSGSLARRRSPRCSPTSLPPVRYRGEGVNLRAAVLLLWLLASLVSSRSRSYASSSPLPVAAVVRPRRKPCDRRDTRGFLSARIVGADVEGAEHRGSGRARWRAGRRPGRAGHSPRWRGCSGRGHTDARHSRPQLPIYNPEVHEATTTAAELIEACYAADGLLWSSPSTRGRSPAR